MSFIQVDIVNVPNTEETVVPAYINVANIHLVARRNGVTIIETSQGALETKQSVAEIIAKTSEVYRGRV